MQPDNEVFVKLGCAAASFAFALSGCIAARQVIAKDKHSSGAPLMACNACAAGVLLAASLVHMLPDSMKALASLDTEFPVAPALAGSCFCFLVFIGEVLGDFLPKRTEPHTKTDCATYEASIALWPRKVLMPPCCDEDCQADKQGAVDILSYPGAECGQLPSCCNKAVFREGSQDPLDRKGRSNSCGSHASRCRQHLHSDGPCSPKLPPSQNQNCLTDPLLAYPGEKTLAKAHKVVEPATPSTCEPSDPGPGITFNCHGVRHDGGGAAVEVKSFLLFAALSFHSVMEGLGLGSADEGVILPVIFAILAHKGLAAFALGNALTQAELPPWQFWTFVMIFAVGTPFGCLVGLLFVHFASTASEGVASGVCTALAAGTFLQVATMEQLPRVLAEENHKALVTGCLSAAFVVMSGLALWV